MWVNKVPNVHVWADHTSVQLLLEILTGALSRLTACLAERNRNVWEKAAEKWSWLVLSQYTDFTYDFPVGMWSQCPADSDFWNHRALFVWLTKWIWSCNEAEQNPHSIQGLHETINSVTTGPEVRLFPCQQNTGCFCKTAAQPWTFLAQSYG